MTRTRAVDGRRHGGSAERRKAVLFCSRCGHESPVDGDWIRTVYEDRLDCHCPDCWAKITTRPR